MMIANYVLSKLAMENPIRSIRKEHKIDRAYLEVAYQETAERVESYIMEDLYSPEYALELAIASEFTKDDIIEERYLRVREEIAFLLSNQEDLKKGF